MVGTPGFVKFRPDVFWVGSSVRHFFNPEGDAAVCCWGKKRPPPLNLETGVINVSVN